MKIPARFQVFDRPVTLSTKDAERLAPHLSHWMKLNEILLLGVPESDIERLVILEMRGQKRHAILQRLIWRYLAVKRVRILERLSKETL